MADTPETKAKKAIRKILDASNCYYIPPATGGYGTSGAPDFMGVVDGKFWGCEVKADTHLTALQKDHLRRIKENGGFAFVVRIKGRTSYGLARFCSFMGVSTHVAGAFTEAAPLEADDFERGGLQYTPDDGGAVVAQHGKRRR